MSGRRRGWVAVEDAHGDWWVLQVYDDGWVEVPGRARDLADTRALLRHLLPRLAGVLTLAVLAVVTSRYGVPVLPQALALAFLALLLVTAGRARRARVLDRRQRRADDEQAERHRPDGRDRVRPRPGARGWTLPRSAAQHAAAFTGVRRVGGEQVSRVDVRDPGEPGPVLVDVWLHDGSWLGYRTPDRTVVELLGPWTRGPVPG